MQLTFYGVRGSCPAPGPEFVKFGGNTACAHIKLNDGTDIILDAGTGIRKLGEKLIADNTDIHILLTHNHWDHIQGFPFFAPIYQAERNIFITPGQTTLSENDNIIKQMSGSYFLVNYHTLRSNIQIKPVAKETQSWKINSATISRLAINHPGGGSSFTIEADGAKIAYITDNELYPPYQKETDFLDWVSFAKDADIIIHDAQYMLSDMPAKSGWGHSIAEEAVKLGMTSRAKFIALYSHDVTRTDKQIIEIEQHCRDIIQIAEAEIRLFAAAEGMSIAL
jgi:phosphoribosyl 1,2-cyclic phosphodiesterase